MQSTKQTGDNWEVIAIKYLQKNWYTIKDTNFKFWRFWEIDIICELDWVTSFIEVKYWNNINFWIPKESLTKSKLFKFK